MTRSINPRTFGVLVRYVTFGIKADVHVSGLNHESYLSESRLKKLEKRATYRRDLPQKKLSETERKQMFFFKSTAVLLLLR